MPPHRLFDRCQFGLELDDKQRPRFGMPREEVDRPALAVFGVGNLRHDGPAEALQTRDDRIAEHRVSAIEEPIQLAATPADQDDDLRIERAEEPTQRSNGQALNAATLDSRHDVVTDADPFGRVDLAQPESMAQCACCSADLEIIQGQR